MRVFSDGSPIDLMERAGPTVVVFAAQWCLPSQNLVRSLDQIDLTPGLRVEVIDVDAHPEVPAKFGVRGLPTTMLFKDGTVQATTLGDLPLNRLRQWVGDLI